MVHGSNDVSSVSKLLVRGMQEGFMGSEGRRISWIWRKSPETVDSRRQSARVNAKSNMHFES